MNNLNIVGSRVYPVRHYLIAVRLRDRKGRAILCVALVPQSGNSSGTTLGVRSVALLHARCSLCAKALKFYKQNMRCLIVSIFTLTIMSKLP